MYRTDDTEKSPLIWANYLFDSDFNSIFNSANLLYMKNTFLTMIHH